tara:strand:- start:14 stop:166 length:153 start_codon:yes stop_codon:yes gene_type:complete
MKQTYITKQQLHTFIDTQIEKHKSKKGRAFFYKKPKRLVRDCWREKSNAI